MSDEPLEVFKSVVTNPINVGLLMVCIYLLYKICRPNRSEVRIFTLILILKFCKLIYIII